MAPEHPTNSKADDNFDGIFDAFYAYSRSGNTIRGEIDRDQDGKPEIIESFWHGTLSKVEFLDNKTGTVVKRVFYHMSKRVQEDVDFDGDGKFERTTYFDDHESPQ